MSYVIIDFSFGLLLTVFSLLCNLLNIPEQQFQTTVKHKQEHECTIYFALM